MVRFFVSKTWPLPLNGAGGHQSLLSSLPPYCISQPPSRLSPLLCSYPNKLAIQVSEGGRKRWRRVWSWVGGWALWRTIRLSVGEVHCTLKRLCLNTHRHTSKKHRVSMTGCWERERERERSEKWNTEDQRETVQRTTSVSFLLQIVKKPCSFPADPNALTWLGDGDA